MAVAGDLYVHADLHGAASTIVKNHVPEKAVPPLSISQAGCACVCRSAAWDAKIVTSAWWVHQHQVHPPDSIAIDCFTWPIGDVHCMQRRCSIVVCSNFAECLLKTCQDSGRHLLCKVAAMDVPLLQV